MNKRLTALILGIAFSAAVQADGQGAIGGLIVRLAPEQAGKVYVNGDLAASLSASAGLELRFARRLSGQASLVQFAAPAGLDTALAAAAAISARPDVRYAVPNYRRQANLVPNDPRFTDQWYLQPAENVAGAASLPGAWDITTGDASTVVAVLDTGILAGHADLGRILAGYDFVVDEPALNIQENDADPGRDADPADPGDGVAADECAPGFPAVDSTWHGTLVAGVIAASTDNSIGIAGVDRAARILPVRVLGKCGGTDADIVDGARWAIGLPVPGVPPNPNPARILNLSLGGFGPCTQVYRDAFDEAEQAGVLVVVSAGNDGAPLDQDGVDVAPAECPGAFTIAATTRQGAETVYTNIGSAVDLAAPGGASSSVSEGILSTSDSGATAPANDSSYDPVIGTSFSAPIVSGVAALALALNPDLTPVQIKQTLSVQARDFPSGTTDGFDDCTRARCGAGLLDARQVIEAVRDGAIPGFFPDGRKIELLGDTSTRDGLATLYLALLSGAALWLRRRYRRA